jgi:hypothetical protein
MLDLNRRSFLQAGGVITASSIASLSSPAMAQHPPRSSWWVRMMGLLLPTSWSCGAAQIRYAGEVPQVQESGPWLWSRHRDFRRGMDFRGHSVLGNVNAQIAEDRVKEDGSAKAKTGK